MLDIWRVGVIANRSEVTVFGMWRGSIGLRLEGGEFLRVDESLLEAGDLALFADSMNQCLIDAS